jgi:hypothetical protein
MLLAELLKLVENQVFFVLGEMWYNISDDGEDWDDETPFVVRCSSEEEAKNVMELIKSKDIDWYSIPAIEANLKHDLHGGSVTSYSATTSVSMTSDPSKAKHHTGGVRGPELLLTADKVLAAKE